MLPHHSSRGWNLDPIRHRRFTTMQSSNGVVDIREDYLEAKIPSKFPSTLVGQARIFSERFFLYIMSAPYYKIHFMSYYFV